MFYCSVRTFFCSHIRSLLHFTYFTGFYKSYFLDNLQRNHCKCRLFLSSKHHFYVYLFQFGFFNKLIYLKNNPKYGQTTDKKSFWACETNGSQCLSDGKTINIYFNGFAWPSINHLANLKFKFLPISPHGGCSKGCKKRNRIASLKRLF
jgi:hypothetical protein